MLKPLKCRHIAYTTYIVSKKFRAISLDTSVTIVCHQQNPFLINSASCSWNTEFFIFGVKRPKCHRLSSPEVKTRGTVSPLRRKSSWHSVSLEGQLSAVAQIGRSLVRTQLVSLEFFIDIKSFRSHCGPGVDSASNRNEYQEHFLGVKAAGA